MRCRDSAEPGRNSGSAENRRRRMHVRVSRRSRCASSCRSSRCGRCSRCSVCARGCPNRGHGGCAGGSPAPRRCSVSRWSAGTCGRPTAGCRSGWCSADRVGRPSGRANRGHGRCCGRQRCAHRFGADDRAAARPAAAAGSARVKPIEKAPEPSRGLFLVRMKSAARLTP
jgi:hypothetical protein